MTVPPLTDGAATAGIAADARLLRRVAGLVHPHWPRLAGLVGSVLVQSGAVAAAPFLVRAMLDDALPRHDLALLAALAGATALAAGIGALAGVSSTRLAHATGHRIVHGLRTAMFEHLQRMPLTFFTHSRTAELQTHLVADVDGLVAVLTSLSSSAIQNGMLLLATATALVLLDWRLGVIAIVASVLLMAITGRVGRERRALTTRRQRGFSALGGLIEESLTASAVVLARTLGRAGDQRKRFGAESEGLADTQLRTAMAGRWRLSLRGAALTTLPAAVYTVAGVQIAAGAAVSIGTVVAFATTLTRVIRPVTALQNAGQGFSGSLALFERVFAVLDLPAPAAPGPDAPPLRVTAGHVEVDGVTVRYDGADRPALSEVRLTVPPGTVTAVVGASGAGKSTLAHVLLGLHRPDRGRVLVDGQDLAAAAPASIADGIGIVTQDTYLFHTTITENLRFARPSASDAEIEAACRGARIHDLIACLPDGYDTLVGDRGHRFSGGERQRLSLARLLLRDPPVVVLDEATSALDNRTELAVRATIADRASARTTVVIAHRLSTVRDADQIVVLDAGRVVESGTHRELLALNGYYGRLVAAGDPATVAGDKVLARTCLPLVPWWRQLPGRIDPMTSMDGRTDGAAGTPEEPLELDAAFMADPHALYPLLRRERPVVRARSRLGMGVWLVTRYEDVRAALNDPRLSKDAAGMRRLVDQQRDSTGPRVHFGEELTAHMLNSDPPDHTRLRKLVNRAFTVRAVASMRPRIEAIAGGLADAMAAKAGAGQHTVDLLDEFAFPLPMTVICEILGVADRDRDKFRAWSNALLSNAPVEHRREAAKAMAGFLVELVEDKRANPGDDMLSEIVRATDGTESSASGTSIGTESSASGTSIGTESSASGTSIGTESSASGTSIGTDRLSVREAVSMAFLLLIAGHETTVNLIGNGTLALLRHPDRMAELRADPELTPSAVEEFLRYDGPLNLATFRYTAEPVSIAGTEIPAGEVVMVSLASANRDQDRYQRPDELNLRRDAQHLAFGYGIHHCLGAPLARLEADVAFRTLLGRFPALSLAAEPSELTWRESTLIRGLTRLPVRLLG